MIQNTIFITVLGVLLASCFRDKNIIEGKTYTISGSLTPFEQNLDSVWADTTIYFNLRYNQHKYYSKTEVIESKTNEYGHFYITYTTLDNVEGELYPDSLSYIMLTLENDSSTLLYTEITKECNITNQHFHMRNQHNIHIPQGVCD